MAKVEDCAKSVVSILKEVVISIENDGTGAMVDNIIQRFPHLTRDIFKELDNESLENCRKINRQFQLTIPPTSLLIIILLNIILRHPGLNTEGINITMHT